MSHEYPSYHRDWALPAAEPREPAASHPGVKAAVRAVALVALVSVGVVFVLAVTR